MKIKHLLAMAALFLVSLASQAGIIYEWHGVKKQSPSDFSMYLEFDEATVASGSFSLQIGANDDQTRPDSGLIRFCPPYACFSPRTEPFNFGMDFGYFDMNVSFLQNKFLVGGIRFFDFQAQIDMGAPSMGPQAYLFTITSAMADYDMGDCAGSQGLCSGGTGHIRQRQIPEPSSIALLGLGAFAAFSIRRRGRKL